MRYILQTITLIAILAISIGCSKAPKRIDPYSSEKVTSMEADYNELIEWSETLTNRMLQSEYLNQYKPYPVRMVISTIENKTDMSRLPAEMVIGRIRASLLNSGKVRVVSSYGDEATDHMAVDTHELKDDPRFKESSAPKSGELEIARLSLRTQFLMIGARTGKERQNTYEVRMFVTDTQSGEVVWEGFSDPVAKKSKKGTVGW